MLSKESCTATYTWKYTLVNLRLPHGGNKKRACGKSRASKVVAASVYSEYFGRAFYEGIIGAVIHHSTANRGTMRPPTTGREASPSTTAEAVTTTTREVQQFYANLSKAER